MPYADKTQEFLEKLKLCIERGELDACLDEAVRLAEEMGIVAQELLDLSVDADSDGEDALIYVLALASAHGLEGNEKSMAYYIAGIAAQGMNMYPDAEEQYKKAIEIKPEYAEAHNNYANLLKKLERYPEAEEQYKKAIEIKPEYAEVHNNYANLLNKLERHPEAEEQYKKAIEIKPEYAKAHNNYANLLKKLERHPEAEEQYKKAIEIKPEYAEAHNNYANLLKKLERYPEAEEQYKKAIEIKPEYAKAHYNYANLLKKLERYPEAEEQYKKAIEIKPEYAKAHNNYANLLKKLERHPEAEEQYKKAIEADPKHANAYGAYGLLLIENDNRDGAWEKTEKASSLFAEIGDLTKSHLAKAWFYERYAEKYFNQRKFLESGQDAGKAGDEYLKAAETTEGALKDNFSQQGNILKAKSFVRKVPKKSWRRKIPIIGKKSNIPEIINNLKQAAPYYEKAALCPIEEKQNVCNACHISITVFSETLSSMEAFINKKSAEINKTEWMKILDNARQIYEERKMKNGVALVDTLKQLILCVDELAVHREYGLGFQKDKCGKCFDKLADVSENLDGALNVLAEHSIEAIRDYANQQGMGGFGDYEHKKSFFYYLVTSAKIIGYIIAFIVSIIAILQFLKIDTRVLEYLKSLLTQL